MLSEVQNWISLPDSKKRMLTLSGPPEVGKSHLLKEVNRLYHQYDSYFPKKTFNYPQCLYIEWPELTPQAIADPGLLETIDKSGLVLIEDFLSEKFFDEKNIYHLLPLNNYTRIVIDFAFRVINLRVGKPTIIDTNKYMRQIKLIDERVSSRLNREDGVFLDIPRTTTPYLDRIK